MAKRKFGIELEYKMPMNRLGIIGKRMSKGVGCEFNYSGGEFGYRGTTSQWRVVPEEDGAELVSPILSCTKELRKAVKKVEEEIHNEFLDDERTEKSIKRLKNSISPKNFGLHVHVDVRDVRKKLSGGIFDSRKNGIYYLDLYHAFYNIQKHLFRMHPKFRRDLHWCTPLDPNDLIEELNDLTSDWRNPQKKLGWWHKEDVGEEIISDLNRGSYWILEDLCEKSSAFCFYAIKEHGSIEYRFGTSSYNHDYVTYWTELCRLVTDRVIASVNKKKIEEPKTFEAFIRYIRPGKNLEKWMRKQHRTMSKVHSPCSQHI